MVSSNPTEMVRTAYDGPGPANRQVVVSFFGLSEATGCGDLFRRNRNPSGRDTVSPPEALHDRFRSRRLRTLRFHRAHSPATARRITALSEVPWGTVRWPSDRTQNRELRQAHRS